MEHIPRMWLELRYELRVDFHSLLTKNVTLLIVSMTVQRVSSMTVSSYPNQSNRSNRSRLTCVTLYTTRKGLQSVL